MCDFEICDIGMKRGFRSTNENKENDLFELFFYFFNDESSIKKMVVLSSFSMFSIISSVIGIYN